MDDGRPSMGLGGGDVVVRGVMVLARILHILVRSSYVSVRAELN